MQSLAIFSSDAEIQEGCAFMEGTKEFNLTPKDLQSYKITTDPRGPALLRQADMSRNAHTVAN